MYQNYAEIQIVIGIVCTVAIVYLVIGIHWEINIEVNQNFVAAITEEFVFEMGPKLCQKILFHLHISHFLEFHNNIEYILIEISIWFCLQ